MNSDADTSGIPAVAAQIARYYAENPEAARIMRQHVEDRNSGWEDAARLVDLFKSAGKKPLVEWRCMMGCSLMKAWPSPDGVVILDHPKLRWPANFDGVWPGADANIDLAKERLTDGGVQVFPRRAYPYQAGRPIYVQCDHRTTNAGPAELAEDLRSARATRRTWVRTVAPDGG